MINTGLKSLQAVATGVPCSEISAFYDVRYLPEIRFNSNFAHERLSRINLDYFVRANLSPI